MNRDILLAILDGEQIQFQLIGHDWEDLNPQDHPNIYAALFTDSNYPSFRIKPEFREVIYKLALMNNGYSMYILSVNTAEEAIDLETNSTFFVKWITNWVTYKEQL